MVTWLLVVFGDKVMKILRNSLFIFHFVLPVFCTEDHTTKVKKKPKTKLPKYVMSRANVRKKLKSGKLKSEKLKSENC